VTEPYVRKPNTVCHLCKQAIYRRPVELAAGRVFCSQICFGRSNRRESPCVICDKPILASQNKKTCSRACSNTNRSGIKYKIGSPKDKVKNKQAIKLRIIALRGPVCERCGYSKIEILHVHHRDRNHKNNEFSNLELICPNCHYEEHYLEKSWLGDKVRNQGGVG